MPGKSNIQVLADLVPGELSSSVMCLQVFSHSMFMEKEILFLSRQAAPLSVLLHEHIEILLPPTGSSPKHHHLGDEDFNRRILRTHQHLVYDFS